MNRAHYGMDRAFESEGEAKACARDVAEKLIADLRSKGFTKFAPPPLPRGFDEVRCQEFADCRVVVVWVPYGAPSSNGGKFVARADTVAEKPEPRT